MDYMTWASAEVMRDKLKARGAAASLARELGISEATVSRWAHGTRPRIELWPRIEELLGLEPGTLNDGVNQRPMSEMFGELQARLDRNSAAIEQVMQIVEAILARLPAGDLAHPDGPAHRAE